MDRGAWWATAHGVAKSQTRLSDTFNISLAGEVEETIEGGGGNETWEAETGVTWPQSKACWQPRTWRRQRTDSPLSLRRSTDLWHPDSSPAILTLNFWPLELWEDSFLCFEARSVSKLLPLPQETDTREKTNPKTCFRKRRTGGLGEVSSSDPQGCSLWIQQGLSCQGNPAWNQRTSWPTATWNAIHTFILGTTRDKNAIMGQTPILWEWSGPPEGVPLILSYHRHILRVEMHTCAFILPTLPSASDRCTRARGHFLSGNTKTRQAKKETPVYSKPLQEAAWNYFPHKT